MRPERRALIAHFLACTLLLGACAGSGPVREPTGGVAPSDPGDAIPRKEPRSRYGNGPYYKVRGVTYRVLDTSHGYREQGVASWYGKKFHGRPTSSQEPYDMYKMTAAHKSLPLPTYVRVRNLENNRSVIVRVNDRGPFIDNRLIDLSYTAAQKLDLIRNGTGMVEVTAISFDDPPARQPQRTVTKSAAAQDKLFLQVGAFGDRENARRQYRLLRRNGFEKVFVFEDKARRPSLFRVRIGPIADASQYDSVVDKLRGMGIADTHLITE